MPSYSREIEIAARNAAKVYTIDEERQKAFHAGVMFVIERLRRLSADDCIYETMLDQSTKKMLAKLTLRDVRQFLDEAYALVQMP